MCQTPSYGPLTVQSFGSNSMRFWGVIHLHLLQTASLGKLSTVKWHLSVDLISLWSNIFPLDPSRNRCALVLTIYSTGEEDPQVSHLNDVCSGLLLNILCLWGCCVLSWSRHIKNSQNNLLSGRIPTLQDMRAASKSSMRRGKTSTARDFLEAITCSTHARTCTRTHVRTHASWPKNCGCF